MGVQRSWYTILLLLMFSFVCSSFGENMNSSRNSLDVLLQEYAFKSLSHTGILYNATLPSNLSGMGVSAVRLRSGNFWMNGANFSGFSLPPFILPEPFVKRLTIVYQNMGNWSSTYYNVPGYTMVTPVISFMLYNATDTSVNSASKLNLSVTGELISIRFPPVILPEKSSSNSMLKCVRFGEVGVMEVYDMEKDNVCLTREQGHFTLVMPVVEPRKKMNPKEKERLWKWLVVGFALGFAGLVLLGLFGVLVYKCVKRKKMGKMEKRADEGESFENIWIGTSRMPSAAATRTQPVLEHNEVP